MGHLSTTPLRFLLESNVLTNPVCHAYEMLMARMHGQIVSTRNQHKVAAVLSLSKAVLMLTELLFR